jgi:flagellar motor switch protein FliG
MALRGKRKAAMLLASLDVATATELLKGQPQEVIQEIAMELSQLDSTGQVEPEEAGGVAKEFCAALHKVGTGGIHVKSFINSLLGGSGRGEKVAEMHAQMQQAIHDKDPFIAITSAAPWQIAAALEGEPTQAIALVLSSLPPKLGTEVLTRLNEDISPKAVWKMTKAGEVSPRTMRRVGEMVCKRLVGKPAKYHHGQCVVWEKWFAKDWWN